MEQLKSMTQATETLERPERHQALDHGSALMAGTQARADLELLAGAVERRRMV